MESTEQSTSRGTQSNEQRSSDRPGVKDRIRQGITTRVSGQKDRAVDGLMQVADTVRRMGAPLRGQGQNYEPVANYVNTAAERVEQAALYLRQHELDEVVEDLRAAARRRPAVFIGAGFLAGAICGRFLKSSNRART